MSASSRAHSHKSFAGRLLMLLALAGLTALVVSHFTDLRQFLTTLHGGNWWWIAAGVTIHLGYFLAYGYLYKLGFDLVGVESHTLALLPVVFAGIFVNAVLPTGGAGAAALFIDDAARRHQSGGRAAIGIVLVLFAELFTLVPFLIWGLVFLGQQGKIAGYDVIGTTLFGAYLAVLLILLILAYRSPAKVRALLGWVRRVVNKVVRRFLKKEPVGKDWAERTTDDFHNAARTFVHRPRALAILSGWAMALHIINIVGVWALIRAFGVILPISGIMAAYGMGIVFFVIAVIPEGVAVVEAVMTLVFHSLGVPQQKAITATLIFRGVNFWLPLLIGIGFLRKLRHFGERAEHE